MLCVVHYMQSVLPRQTIVLAFGEDLSVLVLACCVTATHWVGSESEYQCCTRSYNVVDCFVEEVVMT